MALARSGFFRIAAFQGGTCLRILYHLTRFSEDLDFIVEKPNKSFNWEAYTQNMTEEFSAYGFELEVKDRSNIENAVKTAFLKADSEGGMLIIKDLRTNKPKIKIKLEIDANPPQGSVFEIKYLDFPVPFGIKAQDLSSLVAGKCHALLCRNYTKGRDWFDFIWYVSRNTPINFNLLTQAINQIGPWKNKDINANSPWLLSKLKTKIQENNWEIAKQDVARFLRARDLSTLDLWSAEFFLVFLEKLSAYIS